MYLYNQNNAHLTPLLLASREMILETKDLRRFDLLHDRIMEIGPRSPQILTHDGSLTLGQIARCFGPGQYYLPLRAWALKETLDKLSDISSSHIHRALVLTIGCIDLALRGDAPINALAIGSLNDFRDRVPVSKLLEHMFEHWTNVERGVFLEKLGPLIERSGVDTANMSGKLADLYDAWCDGFAFNSERSIAERDALSEVW